MNTTAQAQASTSPATKTLTKFSEQQLERIKRLNYTKAIYRYCRKYYPDLIKFCRLLHRRAARNKFQNYVGIEGETGAGKSTFTLAVCCCLQHMFQKKFNIERHVLFIPREDELRQRAADLKEFEVFWIDEAIRALDKKKWYMQDQIDLNHIAKTERYKKNTIFLLMPRFSEFNETFRNNNIFWRVYIIPQHSAVVYAKDVDKDVPDPWHTRNNLQIKFNRSYRTKYRALLDPDARLDNERKLPNYVLDTTFPDFEKLPQFSEFWRYYEYLKEKSRYDRKNKDTKKQDDSLNIRERKYRHIAANLVSVIQKKFKARISEIADSSDGALTRDQLYSLRKWKDDKPKKTLGRGF